MVSSLQDLLTSVLDDKSNKWSPLCSWDWCAQGAFIKGLRESLLRNGWFCKKCLGRSRSNLFLKANSLKSKKKVLFGMWFRTVAFFSFYSLNTDKPERPNLCKFVSKSVLPNKLLLNFASAQLGCSIR